MYIREVKFVLILSKIISAHKTQQFRWKSKEKKKRGVAVLSVVYHNASMLASKKYCGNDLSYKANTDDIVQKEDKKSLY